jgi:hypothetical protein
MNPLSREQLLLILKAEGMSDKEADNFLTKGNTILQKVIQLDGRHAAKAIPEIVKMGLLSGVVTLQVSIEASRDEDFVEMIEEICGQEVIRGTDLTGETAKRVAPLALGGIGGKPPVIH